MTFPHGLPYQPYQLSLRGPSVATLLTPHQLIKSPFKNDDDDHDDRDDRDDHDVSVEQTSGLGRRYLSVV